jgi:membrane associated rhomboid family serine protease
VLRSLLMALGLPVDAAHPASRPAFLIWGLLAALFVIFGVQVGDPTHLRHWMLVPSEVLAGRGLSTVVTSTLIHGGLWHLLGNLYMLWMAGDNLEARLGSLQTLLLYLVAGLASSAAVLVTDPSGTIGYLGASGCISGLLGAYTMLFPRSRVHVLPRWGFAIFRPIAVPAIVFFAFWFCLQVWGILSGGEGIAFWAHIGGFIAGAVWGLLARPVSEV